MKKFFLSVTLICTVLYGTDMDNDLVPDSFDKCLNTPAGVFVDKDGCTQEIKKLLNFEHNKSLLDIQNTQLLQQYIQIAQEAFGYKIVVKGHTDAIGTYQSNISLSKNRAYNVVNQMINQGIPQERISIKWYGEAMPIATNVTVEGRALNRRVEIIFE